MSSIEPSLRANNEARVWSQVAMISVKWNKSRFLSDGWPEIVRFTQQNCLWQMHGYDCAVGKFMSLKDANEQTIAGFQEHAGHVLTIQTTHDQDAAARSQTCGQSLSYQLGIGWRCQGMHRANTFTEVHNLTIGEVITVPLQSVIVSDNQADELDTWFIENPKLWNV